MFVGTPLLLGFWWGLLFLPVGIALASVFRAVGEERMLRRELPGYDHYARQVKFRMLPGLSLMMTHALPRLSWPGLGRPPTSFWPTQTRKTWMAGPRPAMTVGSMSRYQPALV
jgi:hypothetical protein